MTEYYSQMQIIRIDTLPIYQCNYLFIVSFYPAIVR